MVWSWSASAAAFSTSSGTEPQSRNESLVATSWLESWMPGADASLASCVSSGSMRNEGDTRKAEQRRLGNLVRRARGRRLAQLLEARDLRVGQRPAERLAPEGLDGRASRQPAAAGSQLMNLDLFGSGHHRVRDLSADVLDRCATRRGSSGRRSRRRGLGGRLVVATHAGDTEEVAHHGFVLPVQHAPELGRHRDAGSARSGGPVGPGGTAATAASATPPPVMPPPLASPRSRCSHPWRRRCPEVI